MSNPHYKAAYDDAAPSAATGAFPIARLIAFYLPQFHPIPENNEWWGPGFTEWTNVAKAKPLFSGHWQPRLPADLGYYDLRVPEVREAQARLARDAGIEGFCYWHYWFGGGKRILERPFREVVESGKPDFPFCLAWANQSWTGIWHGSPRKILVEQTYPGPEDEKAHFMEMLPAFRDKRYMRTDGKLIFVLFDPADHPSVQSFMEHWQQLAKKEGLGEFYFIGMSNRPDHPNNKYFDAITPYGPNDFINVRQNLLFKIKRRLKSRDFGNKINALLDNKLKLPARYDYARVVAQVFSQFPDDPRYVPGVLPNWDNTPRSGKRGVVFENTTPELFREYLAKALAIVAARPPQKKLVFLKAWNEWAEGNYIEPDARYGHQYLDVIRSLLLPQKQACGVATK